MSTYLEPIFTNNINKSQIKTIFELGSRDLLDAIKLYNFYNNVIIYAFECNPDCLNECEKTLQTLNASSRANIFLINKAVSEFDGDVEFYPFDPSKYNNIGASSMLKIDFLLRNKDDPDYGKSNPQKEISVSGTRIDSFMLENNIQNIDLLCIDLQGYELNAIKSIGDKLRTVKYIITECSIHSTYSNGVSFNE